MSRPAAIVTGDSSGIRRATALRLAQDGFDVEITFHCGEERASAVAQMIKAFAAIEHQDLSNPAETTGAIDSLIGRLGRLDAFVNNVGINHRRGFLELPLGEWLEVLAVNLAGAFLCGQAAARRMVSLGTAGRIVNVTSISDRETLQGGAAYFASKAGLRQLSRVMALELAPYKIRVNGVPSPNRPFEIYPADSVVRAVGTVFAVHIEKSKIDVTVTNGAVDVAKTASVQTEASHAPTESIPATRRLARVKAAEATHISGGSDHIEVRHLAEPELQRRMAWQAGYLAFLGEPLSEVVEQVNRYSTVQLEVEDPKVASIPIGGCFRIGDLDAVLDVLQSNLGIRAHKVDEHSIRLKSEYRH